jgi:AAHS family 3-hydroxyphenylpropionic acid transporter
MPTVTNTTTIDGGRISGRQVLTVVLCVLVTLIEGTDLTLLPVLASRFRDAWSVTQETWGSILMCGIIGTIVGGLLMGWLGDRIGRRTSLITAMVLMTVVTFATTWCTTVPQLMLVRFLGGISFGGVIPAAVALVAEALPVRVRGNVVAFVFLGQAGGGVLAPILVKLPMMAGPWQTPVLWVAGGCAAVTLLVVLLLPESPRFMDTRAAEAGGPQRRWFDQFVELFTQGRATGTVLLWITFVGICFAVSYFTNSLAATFNGAGKPDDYGIDATKYYSIGAMVGGLILPLFARRWRGTMVLLAAIIGAVASCITISLVLPAGYTENMSAAFACGVFVSGAFFLLYPPAVQFYPTQIRATGIGAAIACGRTFGNVPSPKVAGYMLGAGGYAASSVFLVVAAPMVVSCITLIIFDRYLRRSQQGAP